MEHRIAVCSFAVVFAALGLGCGGEPPQPETPPPPPPGPEAPVEPAAPAPPPAPAPGPTSETPKEPPKPQWKDFTMDQRKEHMKTVVLPEMTTLFQGFDAKKFAKVTCATCHGADGEKNLFKMPNAKLPKLDPTDGFKKHTQGKSADMAKFMMEKVTPKMVSLLPGATQYDPGTQKGFGCFGCHPPPK